MGRFRLSLGLVVALAIALFCNIYLVVLIWSASSGQTQVLNDVETASSSVHVSKQESKLASINHVNYSLNVQSLTLLLNPAKRLVRKPDKSVISLVNSIKRQLKPRGELTKNLLASVDKWVSPTWLIPQVAPELGDVMKYLSSAPIIRAQIPRVGTQLKVLITLEGGQKALLKPQWYNRSTVIEGAVYSGADRHNGEIVSFYLSLILGLRRTPVAVGRRINLSTDILSKADHDLAATFFKSNESTTCFYGVCRYCKRDASVCGGYQDDVIEAAIILWLPSTVKLKSHRSPWQRTYSQAIASWERDDEFCTKLQNQSKIYRLSSGKRRLLDLVDASIFDFIISNGDRHHYELIDTADAAVLLLDNGKSFGNSHVDYLDILAPLYQCCVIRKSTFSRLQVAERGPLGAIIQELALGDSLQPLLTDDHVQAINRRLVIIMQTIELCAAKSSWTSVLIPSL